MHQHRGWGDLTRSGEIWNFRVPWNNSNIFHSQRATPLERTQSRGISLWKLSAGLLYIVTRPGYIPFRPRAFRIFIATPLSRLIIRFPYQTLGLGRQACRRNAVPSGLFLNRGRVLLKLGARSLPRETVSFRLEFFCFRGERKYRNEI